MTWIALLTVFIAACTAAPAVSPTPSALASPSMATGQGPSVELPIPSIASGTTAPAGRADVLVAPDVQVVYTGENVAIWASAFPVGAKTMTPERLDVATATITFGDGTRGSVSQSCTAPAARLGLRHVYATAAEFSLSVAAATLCQTGWRLNLDSGEGIRVFPAAAPGTADWPICSASQLKLTDGGSGAGLGNVATLIHLTNTSRFGCNVEGYPELQLVSSSGALLPTHSHQATDGDYMFAALRPARVALGHGDVASLEFGYGDNPSGDGKVPYDVACPPARSLRMSIPGTREYATVAVTTAPCGGYVNVSPIFPGSNPIGFP